MKMQYLVFRLTLLTALFCLFRFESKSDDTKLRSDQLSNEEVILNGAMLFEGSIKLDNGGSSCISCHNINTSLIVSGGLLAKDLTNVYSRMGDAGISGILGAPPFPAMASTYRNKKLTDKEIEELKAFLQFVDVNSANQASASKDEIFLVYGPIGLIVWLIVIYFLWFNRKKESVKKSVFDRQIKSIN